MYELLEKIDVIIKEKNEDDYEKFEKIFIDDTMYKLLDTDEQIIVLEEVKEKFINYQKKKDQTPSYTDTKHYMKKNKYYHSKEHIEPIMVNYNGKLVSEGEMMSSIEKAVMIKETTDDEYERRANIFNKAKSIILPAQKSAEWHAQRSGRVTGSDAGCVLNMNKYEAQYNFILKKVLGSDFFGNYATYNGNVFEEVIRMMYEYNNDVHTEEFGLLVHNTNPILAASPDGICSPYCRDKKTPSQLVGRMIEIKCPLYRKIQYTGDIKDTICPIYYWCQIQQQLECLDLDECDFLQCNIGRYSSRKEWIEDTNSECDFKSKKYGLERGIVIELIPSKLSEADYNERGYFDDMTIWNKTKCLYPPKIDMTLKELDLWVLEQIDNIDNNWILHKVIYWRLIERNCTLILRDKEWFNSQLPTYEKIWEYVKYLRNNLDVIEEWKNWIDELPRKYNDRILAKLDELIEKKEKLKLNNNNNINEIKNKIIENNNNDNLMEITNDIIENKNKNKDNLIEITNDIIENKNKNIENNIIDNTFNKKSDEKIKRKYNKKK